MEIENKYVNIFTGSEVNVILLKSILEQEGIATMVKNEQESARVSGFGGGSYAGIRLYVQAFDKIKALPIVAAFNDE